MKEWNKIFFWIKKRSKTDWLVIGLIGMLLVIFAIPTKEKATKEDGLVHISQLTDKKFVKHPLEVVSVGDVVEVKVMSVDLDKKRIQLTMKL